MLLSAAALTTSRNLLVIAAAQTLLALLVVAASIHRQPAAHDAVPSTIRSGVASGVGAVSWIAFLPFALRFGAVSKGEGVHAAWMIVAATVLAGAVLVKVAVRRPAPCPGPAPSKYPSCWPHEWVRAYVASMTSTSTATKILLSEDELPTRWYNVLHDCDAADAASGHRPAGRPGRPGPRSSRWT